jgi:hypothetical protein
MKLMLKMLLKGEMSDLGMAVPYSHGESSGEIRGSGDEKIVLAAED